MKRRSQSRQAWPWHLTRKQRLRVTAIAGFLVSLLWVMVPMTSWARTGGSAPELEPSTAQTKQQPLINIAEAVPLVYEQLSFLPLENQYVGNDGEPKPESTLLSRMMYYHLSVQRRQPFFRLDWKLTLADYLGANETIFPSTYPNVSSLQENPIDGDVTAIRALNRAQRDQLVDAIVLLLNPLASRSLNSTSPSPASNPEADPRPQPVTPQEPRPGDAQLLLP